MGAALQSLRTLRGHSGPVYSLCCGPSSGQLLSASADGFVAGWNTLSGEQLPMSVRIGEPLYSVAYSSVHQLVFSGTSAGSLHAVSLTERAEVRHLRQHSAGLYHLLVDHATQRLFVCGGDGVLSVWHLPQMILLRAIPLSGAKLRRCALSAGGLLAVADGEGFIHVLDTEWFNELHTLNAHEGAAYSVAWHPAKPVIVSGGRDGFIRCFNMNDKGREVLALAAHNAAVYDLHFSPGGRWLASASRDKTVKLWNAQTMEAVARGNYAAGGHSHSVNSLCWLDDEMLATSGDEGSLVLWQCKE